MLSEEGHEAFANRRSVVVRLRRPSSIVTEMLPKKWLACQTLHRGSDPRAVPRVDDEAGTVLQHDLCRLTAGGEHERASSRHGLV